MIKLSQAHNKKILNFVYSKVLLDVTEVYGCFIDFVT